MLLQKNITHHTAGRSLPLLIINTTEQIHIYLFILFFTVFCYSILFFFSLDFSRLLLLLLLLLSGKSATPAFGDQ